MSKIFEKDIRSVLIFSIVPLVYYVYDYIAVVYTDLWEKQYHLTAEFLSFSLCIFYVLFCVVYYKEYEKKIEAEHNEQIIRIVAQQQAKEVETVKNSNLETSILRHDMRLLLSNLALYIEEGDKDLALKTISGFTNQVESSAIHRYCKNETVNYILANFESKCREQETEFNATVEIDQLLVDEIIFSLIISNALDNALNAQTELPKEARKIKLMLKNSDGKFLLSVKNHFKDAPVFVDGLPVTQKKDTATVPKVFGICPESWAESVSSQQRAILLFCVSLYKL